MYKLIACDLDETLLGTGGVLPEANVDAIARARKAGVKFVPASGRGYRSMDKMLKDLDVWDLPEEYVISFNGGAVTENKDSRLLHFQGLPYDLACRLFERGLDYDVCIHVYTRDKVYVFRLNEDEKNYVGGRMEIIECSEKNLDFLKGQTIVKVLFENTDVPYLEQIASEMEDLTGPLDVSYSSNRYLEFNQGGVNKGSGLKFLAEYLGCSLDECIAIGDNSNDLSMIQEAGMGVGVKNSAEAIKPFCNYITQADNNHGAVAEVIDKFIFGKDPQPQKD